VSQLALKIAELVDVEKKKTAYLFPNAVRPHTTPQTALPLTGCV
jgi:hypothetical protein